jgi:hypothetical protein
MTIFSSPAVYKAVPPVHHPPLFAVPLVPTLFFLHQALRELLPAGLRFLNTLVYLSYFNHGCWTEGANRPQSADTYFCFGDDRIGRLV